MPATGSQQQKTVLAFQHLLSDTHYYCHQLTQSGPTTCKIEQLDIDNGSGLDSSWNYMGFPMGVSDKPLLHICFHKNIPYTFPRAQYSNYQP